MTQFYIRQQREPCFILLIGDELVKGGPYIGPRGGKWADAKHTIPYDAKKHAPKQFGLFTLKPAPPAPPAAPPADKVRLSPTAVAMYDPDLYGGAGGYSIFDNGDFTGSMTVASLKAKKTKDAAEYQARVDAYDDKQDAKKERFRIKAEKLRGEAKSRFKAGDLREEASGIPMGQPILVGHHSEKRHRRAIERANANIGKGIEAEKKAAHYEQKAKGVARAGISSDDPAAVVKLKKKIEMAEQSRDLMKKLNAAFKKHKGDWPKIQKAAGASDKVIASVKAGMARTPWTGDKPFQSYTMTNLGANIRRMKQRVDLLREAAATPEAAPVVGKGYRIEESKEDNRIRFYFDEKPSRDITKKMKSAGFRWSPTAGAWQRHLNNAGRYATEQMAKEIFPDIEKSERFVFVDPLQKAGPYIGPRGGKWQDPQHKIPWTEGKAPRGKKAIPGKGDGAEQWGKLPPGKTAQEHVKIARAFLKRHEAALPGIKTALVELAGKSGNVKGRVKTLPSALGKMVRKPKYKTADDLQDGTGLRVVHKTISEVKATVAKIRSKYKVIGEDNYIDTPQGSYRSHHLIIEGPGGLAMEVQIRTANQNIMADWSHDVYKPVNEEQAKHRSDPEVLTYEKSMADFMWADDNEKDPPPPVRPPCTKVISRAFGCL